MGASHERMLDALEDAKREPERQELLKEFKRRCDDAKIECTVRTLSNGQAAVEVRFRAGRESRSFIFQEIDELTTLLNFPFEKVVLLGDYVATCSYNDGTIEAAARPLHPFPFIRARLLGAHSDSGGEKPVEVRSPNGIDLAIGPPSAFLTLLHQAAQPGITPLSVRIRGAKLKNHDHAIEVLEGLTSALFLQLDMLSGPTWAWSNKGRRCALYPGSRVVTWYKRLPFLASCMTARRYHSTRTRAARSECPFSNSWRIIKLSNSTFQRIHRPRREEGYEASLIRQLSVSTGTPTLGE